ncbi:lasso peptide biosynthesis B2 protein [Sphingobium sp.]|uniref:lasso peptide biosynthesis B2 protein n=1 Tax=Sphingobium sp. TaxID=1912891 RepID=UPI00257FD772|nr:lasso peptide biosynthesis B2 protein [Sphingobium sp.]
MEADRYFAMPGPVGQCLSTGNSVSSEERAVLAPLFRRGFLLDGSGGAPPSPTSIEIPQISILDDLHPNRLRPALLATTRLVSTIIRLRQFPLLKIIEGLRARRLIAGPRQTHDARLIEREEASAFVHSDRIMSRNRQCLASSIALLDRLASKGCYPTMVFGVRVDPFLAHCWVQNSHMVLNDDADRVREFTPILVV